MNQWKSRGKNNEICGNIVVCTLIADCLITAETDEAECDDIVRKLSLRARDENIAFTMNTVTAKQHVWGLNWVTPCRDNLNAVKPYV